MASNSSKVPNLKPPAKFDHSKIESQHYRREKRGKIKKGPASLLLGTILGLSISVEYARTLGEGRIGATCKDELGKGVVDLGVC